jgi:DNA-binding response OmpR family regulator
MKPARILLVDDDAALRAVITRALQQAGHKVMPARDGRDALTLLNHAPVDLIITDLLMPEQDGIELILRVRRCRPKLPILAISGGGNRFRGEYYLQMAKVIGATRLLPKPFTAESLLAEVSALLLPAAREV